jgi:hypothetical protein
MRRTLVHLTLAAAVAAGVGISMQSAAAKERTVRLDAIVANGGEPLYDAMAIDVWRLTGDGGAQRVAERHAAPAEVALDPGRYRIEAIYGNARTVQDITVKAAGGTRQVINLNAGQVGLSLRPSIEGDPIREPLDWEVRRYRRGDAPGRKVAEMDGDNPRLWLSEGWYEVNVQYRDRTVGHVVEVAAGQTFDYTLVLNQ